MPVVSTSADSDAESAVGKEAGVGGEVAEEEDLAWDADCWDLLCDWAWASCSSCIRSRCFFWRWRSARLARKDCCFWSKTWPCSGLMSERAGALFRQAVVERGRWRVVVVLVLVLVLLRRAAKRLVNMFAAVLRLVSSSPGKEAGPVKGRETSNRASKQTTRVRSAGTQC